MKSNSHFLHVILSSCLCFCVAVSSGFAAEANFPNATAKLQSSKPLRIVCFGDSVTGVYYHTGSRRAYTDMVGIALKKACCSGCSMSVKASLTKYGVDGRSGVDISCVHLSRLRRMISRVASL